jgi:hypothetical protein
MLLTSDFPQAVRASRYNTFTSLLLVRVERLASAPQALRDYVRQFCIPVHLAGHAFMMALRVVRWKRGLGLGIAPAHRDDLLAFTEGLGGLQLNEWIARQTRDPENDLLSEMICWAPDGFGERPL